jgi:hypothetical protein
MIIFVFKGGLGNQLFQLGQVVNLKKSNSIICILNNKNTTIINLIKQLKIPFFNNNFFFSLILKILLRLRFIKNINDLSFNEYENLKKYKYFYFDGYWQKKSNYFNIDKYMHLIDKDVHNLFINFMKQHKIEVFNSVCVHVRRGDYISNPIVYKNYGRICNFDYFKNGIEHFTKINPDFNFVFFSNDNEWVNENFRFMNNKIIVNSGLKDYQLLYLMSKFNLFIISNSSLSIWATYGKEDAIVFYPKKWTYLEIPKIEELL